VIIITALLVASLLLSTAIYVIETEKAVPTVGTNENNVLNECEQCAKSTLISALANITNGGETNVLDSDLSELNSVITSNSYQAILQMDYAPQNEAPYQNGLCISWGTDGQGVSSAYVSFAFNSSGSSSSSSLQCNVNVTSEVNLSGNYVQLDGSLTKANLSVNVLNEGSPALAQSFTFYFENPTEGWVQVASPNINDFGNGTYVVSFTAETDMISNPLIVSMICQDQRGIAIGANVTCTNTSY
jgi:hypothetical protein